MPHGGGSNHLPLTQRPLVVHHLRATATCAICEARPASVCSAVAERDLEQLAAVAIPLEVEAGRTIIREGDVADSFFNVTKGTARLFKSLPDGRRQITGFAGRGHFLGLAGSGTYAFGAEAITPVHYCRFPRARLRSVLADFPAFERRLLDVASNELGAAQEQMLLLGRKTARERVASFLLARSEEVAPCMGRATLLHLSMTRGDIADYLGLTIETVSRTFSRLKADAVIGIPNTSDVVIQDHPRLTAEASGPH